MPHVTVRMNAGRSEAVKAQLAEAITQAVMTVVGSQVEAVSVGIEDVQPSEWMTQVYGPEIEGKQEQLYKRPGYGPAK